MPPTNRHSGFSVTELIIAMVVLSSVLATGVPIVIKFAQQRKAQEHRIEALEAASNILERISVLPYSEISNEKLANMNFIETLPAQFQSHELKIAVTESADEIPLKTIALELRPVSTGNLSTNIGTISLTSWKYQPVERQP